MPRFRIDSGHGSPSATPRRRFARGRLCLRRDRGRRAFAAKYVTGGDTEVTSIKLTGGGLPDLGQTSTYGVAELPGAIRSYHDSGAYDSDLVTVDAQARKALSKQLKALAGSPGPGKYSECNDKGRKCHKVKPAIVLDIDETSLSNYEGLNAANFSAAGTVTGAVAGNDPVIAPTLALYEYARSKGVEAFFITGRRRRSRPRRSRTSSTSASTRAST